ncbi:MAG: FUSC family protein [Polyangiales bacterium]
MSEQRLGTYRNSFIVREALRIANARPDWFAGLRGALATALPLLLAAAWHTPELTYMSLAGFSTALSDKGGAYRTRAFFMLVLAVCGATVTVLGTLCAAHTIPALLLTLSVVFAGAFVRLFGAQATSVGITVSFSMVLALAQPAPSVASAFWSGAAFLAGCAWAAFLALVLWPLRPYRPIRFAIGGALRELAQIAESLVAASTQADAQVSRRVQLGKAREAIEAARAQSGTARRGRPGPTKRGEQLVALLEAIDQLFGALVALEDGLALESPASLPLHRAWVDQAARLVAHELPQIAEELQEEVVPGSHVAHRAEAAALQRSFAQPADAAGEHVLRVLALTLERLEQVAELARAIDDPAAPQRASRAEPTDLTSEASRGSLVRDNLTLDSAIFRHALRASISTGVALLAMHALHVEHGYWATLTCVAIIQPHGAATWAKALQRVIGTIIGAGLAMVITHYVHDPRIIIALVCLLIAIAMALLPLNYGVFAVFLTPAFVLLAAAHGGPQGLAWLRVTNTLIGAVAALLGARVLFPLSERDALRPAMARALGALLGLLEVVARPELETAQLRAARRKLGLALLNAEASYQRLLTETGIRPEESEALLSLLLHAHRLSSGLIALGVTAGTPAHARLVARADELKRGIAELRDAIAECRPPLMADALPAPKAGSGRVDALFEQLAVLRGAAARWQC